MVNKELFIKLNEYKSKVSEVLDISEMYLFGSFARDNANENSDIDIAVILNKPKDDFLSDSTTLWKLRRKIDLRIEPVLFQSESDPSGFIDEIKKTGILI
ncbi:nucleotidyltransferase domain-containing protein [Candidatus Kapabacteria bacterium]|nr:nucleotidyltransferase domain-containing protein [Candidatus Kapabacteria bacterium]